MSDDTDKLEVGNHGWLAHDLLERTVEELDFENERVELYRLDTGQYLAKVEDATEYNYIVTDYKPKPGDYEE